MRVRGERECQDCGSRWSYYEAGRVTCPDCESAVSVGVDDRQLHTDGNATLDLAAVRTALDERGLDALCDTPGDDLATELRTYRHSRGFVSGGDLLVLDETYLAAAELRHEVALYDPPATPAVETYFLALLGGVDTGERPPTGDMPERCRAPRGLAVAESVLDYRDDANEWLRAVAGDDPPARRLLERVTANGRRVLALQGDVPPDDAETLVAATRDIGRHLRTGASDALDDARRRLDALD